MLADCSYGCSEVSSAAVGQIVAGDRCDDDKMYAESSSSLSDSLWFSWVKGLGLAMLDGAEAAVASADVAKNHEGGCLAAEALANVGAAGLLTDSVDAAAGKDAPGEMPLASLAYLHTKPGR